jgi:hypothetical protein
MLAISFLFCLSGTLAFAFTHEDLYPFLEVQLPGYTADELDGFEAGGSIIAARDYFKGGNEDIIFGVSIVLGQALNVSPALLSNQGLKGKEHLYKTSIQGFKADVTKGGEDCTLCGGILVHLEGKNRYFVCNYQNITDKEAISLINRFDLKAISKAIKNVQLPEGGMMKIPGMGGESKEEAGELGY